MAHAECSGDDKPQGGRPRGASAPDLEHTELQMQQLHLQAIFDLSPMAMWITERGHIVYANRAAKHLFGDGTGMPIGGACIYSMVHPDAHPALGRHISHAQSHRGEWGLVPIALLPNDSGLREVEIGLCALPGPGDSTLQMVLNEATQRQREVQKKEVSRWAFQQPSVDVEDAREEERRRIARELHDELGQRLSALKMDLLHCATHAGWDGKDPRVSKMLVHVDEITASVRRIASDLRPLMLEDLGLKDSIEALAHGFSDRQGIQVRLQLDDLDAEVDERMAIALYRMVQEALTNVARHAHASEVDIRLVRRNADIELIVHDNGVGLQQRSHPSDRPLGLLGMRERARILGGRFELANRDGGGSRVRVLLPLVAPCPPPPCPPSVVS